MNGSLSGRAQFKRKLFLEKHKRRTVSPEFDLPKLTSNLSPSFCCTRTLPLRARVFLLKGLTQINWLGPHSDGAIDRVRRRRPPEGAERVTFKKTDPSDSYPLI